MDTIVALRHSLIDLSLLKTYFDRNETSKLSLVKENRRK